MSPGGKSAKCFSDMKRGIYRDDGGDGVPINYKQTSWMPVNKRLKTLLTNNILQN